MALFDLVTIAHFEEWAALRLQALSIRRWLQDPSLGSIWLVVNESEDDPRYPALSEEIKTLYGSHAAKLRVLGRNEVHSNLDDVSGYVSQQILKLRMNQLVQTPYYVVLDTKNALIGPVGKEYFFENDRPRAKFETFSGSFQSYILDCYYEYLGVPPPLRRYNVPTMMTPFIFITDTVSTVIQFLERHFSCPLEHCFTTIFNDRFLFSEFLLYDACLHKLSVKLESIYAPSGRMSATLWENDALGVEALKRVLENALTRNINIIGLHRKRRAQMTGEEVNFLTTYFRRREVLSSDEDFRAA